MSITGLQFSDLLNEADINIDSVNVSKINVNETTVGENLTLKYITPSFPLKADINSKVISEPIDLANGEVKNTLPILKGGTNSNIPLTNNKFMISNAGAIMEASQLTDGQIFIGVSTSAPMASSITGTTNRISVTTGPGSISLSTPQDIATSSNVVFNSMSLADALSTPTGTIGDLTSALFTNTQSLINSLTSTTATITNATIPTLISTNSTISTALISTLTSTNANITSATIPTLTATNSTISTGLISTLTSTNTNITTGTIGTLTSTTSNINTLTSTNANITNLTCGSLSLSSASFPVLASTNANITNLTCSSINNNVLDVINSGTAQTLNIGTTSSTITQKTVNIGSTVNDSTMGFSVVKVGRNNMLEFGSGVAGKEANAGKIGYGTFDSGASLNIIGAGTASNRLIRMWEHVGINTPPSTLASLTTNGAITIGGSSRLNLFNDSYSVRAESSALRFYVNGGTTSMLNLDNNSLISTTFPIRTTSNIGLTVGSFNSVITASSQSANRTVNIPTVGDNAEFVLTQADQTITGTKTFTDNTSTGQINLFNSNYSVRANNSGGQLIFRVNGSDMITFDQVANRINANLIPVRSVAFRVRSNPATFDTVITSSGQGAERTVNIPAIGANASFVMTEADQTINGVKTFSNGLLLPTTGGTQTNLNYYEEFTYTNTWSGPWASARTGDLRVIRVGKLVTLYFPTVNFTGTIASVINWDGTLQTRHLPGSATYGPATISNNLGGFSSGGRVFVNGTGAITIGATNTGGAFSGTGSNGFVNFSISYFIA